MIEPLDDMPEGTIGFRATGLVTRDEYDQILLPPMRAAAEAGDVRMVFAVGPDFDRFQAGVIAEDTKMGLTLGVGHHSAWKRMAILTDVDWIAHASHMFSWLVPGELMVGDLDALAEAKVWVAS